MGRAIWQFRQAGGAGTWWKVCAEEHIELAGFVLRVLKEELEAGTYRIGMLCTNQVTGEKAFAWSGKEIEIAGRERAD